MAALAYWQTGAIENEGAEYASIAENLRNGIGFVGIAMPGTELLFNPLFPALIAAASFVTHNYEWATRIVSLLLGGLLPLLVFGVTSRLFSRRVGLVAALLTAFHPLLVNLSFTGLSEGPYMVLLLLATYAVVRALDDPSILTWSLAGASFGLAYLLRAEAVAPFLLAIAFAFTATAGRIAVKCQRAIAAIGVFLVIALPEVILIYTSTGNVMLEGKSRVFFDVGTRILSAENSLETNGRLPDGLEPYSTPARVWGKEGLLSDSAGYRWAHYAVDTDLRKTGTTMRTNAEVIRETNITLKGWFRLIKAAMRDKPQIIVHRLLSGWLGPPFLLLPLALLGALSMRKKAEFISNVGKN